MAGHDAVVHFAAESHVDRSIAGSEDFILTNCFGTNVVIDAARRLNISRVLHIGTDEVYGSVETGSSREGDPLEPRSPYSASKAGSDFDRAVVFLNSRHASCSHALHQTTLVHFNILKKQFRCLQLICSTARRYLYMVTALTNVTGSTSMITVQVFISHLSTASQVRFTTLVLANETANRVLVDKLLALLGKDESSVQYVADRLGHDRRYSVDITKITKLGWKRSRSP